MKKLILIGLMALLLLAGCQEKEEIQNDINCSYKYMRLIIDDVEIRDNDYVCVGQAIFMNLPKIKKEFPDLNYSEIYVYHAKVEEEINATRNI